MTILSLAKLFLFSPTEAARMCEKPHTARTAFKIAALFAVLQLASSWFNPLAFLDPNAPIPVAHGLLFWAHVGLWEPILMGMSIFFAVMALDWMSLGWLPAKTAIATLWTAGPVALSLAYVANHSLSRSMCAIGLLLWVSPIVYLARRISYDRWRKITVFMLGLYSIQIACLILEYLIVVPIHSRAIFYGLSAISLIWVLTALSLGMRQLLAMSAPRAILAFLFSLVLTAVVPVLSYLIGLMAKEVLKVVLYV
jgi:hypothetical protein